jgi:transmembrane sensor
MTPYHTNERLPQRLPTAIERDALEWVARLDRGMTPEQEAEFDRWLAADVRHAAVFSEFDGTWTLLDRVREMPDAVAAASYAECDPEVLAPSSHLAASLVRDDGASSRGGAAATDLTWWQAYRLASRRWVIPASLAAAAVFLVAYFRWPLANVVDERNAAYAMTAATELGELRKVALPDGSIVQLNTDSAADVQFSSSERRLRLTRGEAHFTVAKNRARPFTVSAGGVDVRAIGTEFNVRLRSAAVEVLVTEGKVMVGDEPSQRPHQTGAESAADTEAPLRDGSADSRTLNSPSLASLALAAGEKITIPTVRRSGAVSTPAASVAVPRVEIEHTLAWRERRLEFVSTPLSEMVAEFNRYNRGKLVIADHALANQRFGGVFRPDDSAGFVRALEVNFGVVAEQRAAETILRLAAP